ncbi:hypothetical protein SORBI_3003G198550 [Sorghum bicolor]|uniref:Uncharacterized protein n=1 Tax=Sorghum bicolor TaxID=4558 RepID=A0A1W0VY39_SORBI|nr:hypothetical protein SORBI_3003G198550 [Sorghum bicolor]
MLRPLCLNRSFWLWVMAPNISLEESCMTEQDKELRKGNNCNQGRSS